MKPVNLLEYEPLAQARVEADAWDYYQGGSDDEVTLQANRSAFERVRLRPRVLIDASKIDTRTTVLGAPISMPIMIAPMACHVFAHPEAECATARAAGQEETLMAVSTVANRTIEEIAEVAGGPLWFQLYTNENPRVSERLVQRADAAGYRAVILTVDTPRLGRRERDIRNQFKLEARSLLANFQEAVADEPTFSRHVTDTWETVDWLRTVTKLPLLLKGILTAEDALLAVERGVEGIIVSNHGGRQLDGSLAAIEALPEIAEAVAGRCEIYLDGGVRRGTDVLKALALGARAIFIGRPILWGLAVDGQEGARHILQLLRNELEVAMGLSGCPTLASINRSLVKML